MVVCFALQKYICRPSGSICSVPTWEGFTNGTSCRPGSRFRVHEPLLLHLEIVRGKLQVMVQGARVRKAGGCHLVPDEERGQRFIHRGP